jgi:hypothetical protein
MSTSAEHDRLDEDARRARNWKRWGPYLSARQWGTVREDYSADGDAWRYFPHDHARSRAYRWGEDGLLGLTDREERLCFAIALWNGRDPILKERLFGLANPEGNHGEDAKECWYYLDATPTSSYLVALYKYPQAEFPYARLVAENARRGKLDPEYELEDAGVFDDDRYFDVRVEYAKAAPEDICIRIVITNRGPDAATLHLLPTLWFRNTWSWGRHGADQPRTKPELRASPGVIAADHDTHGRFRLVAEAHASLADDPLVTENETNTERLYGVANAAPHVKDAFDRFVVHGEESAVRREGAGTKAAFHYVLDVGPHEEIVVRLRLAAEDAFPEEPFDRSFDETFGWRQRDADAFYAALLPANATAEERRVMRQAYAGLLWSRQFYHYVVRDWLEGDPAQPTPPASRRHGRNADWMHLYNRGVLSMPDTWEYPWYAAWDLAFHAIPLGTVDATFAKEQMLLLMREWYMHPSGQLPAYEFALDDANPPVHAWACWRLYKTTARRGERDLEFLERAFHKLLINFTWWVNRKDVEGNHLFSGGFLGLDNIGVFDRSKPMPGLGVLEQADGTAWMAFYAGTMLGIALELAHHDAAYEDVASKFFEHYVAIADAMNTLGESGLWDETDGFYYDELHAEGMETPLRIRSMVGLIPLFAVEVLDEEKIEPLAGFRARLEWFLDNRPELARQVAILRRSPSGGHDRRLLAIPTRERLVRVLRYVLDEREFLSPFGVRSLSKVHREHPFVLSMDGAEARVAYDPGESTTGLFGGNSNWRGPVWFPVNYLLIEALERYHHFYGDTLRVECPVGSGLQLTLAEVAHELSRRLASLFRPDARGERPCDGGDPRYAHDPHWQGLVRFHEYFHGDTGRGLGASHQTGWTALVVRCIEDAAKARG